MMQKKTLIKTHNFSSYLLAFLRHCFCTSCPYTSVTWTKQVFPVLLHLVVSDNASTSKEHSQLLICFTFSSSSLRGKKNHEVCFHRLCLLSLPGSCSQRIHGEGKDRRWELTFLRIPVKGKAQYIHALSKKHQFTCLSTLWLFLSLCVIFWTVVKERKMLLMAGVVRQVFILEKNKRKKRFQNSE